MSDTILSFQKNDTFLIHSKAVKTNALKSLVMTTLNLFIVLKCHIFRTDNFGSRDSKVSFLEGVRSYFICDNNILKMTGYCQKQERFSAAGKVKTLDAFVPKVDSNTWLFPAYWFEKTGGTLILTKI